MSICATHVTKTYGTQQALNAVSFDIPTGQVVGFLGPNGAGKSTMMKIITCYLGATSGHAEVCGVAVHEKPLAVKRLVGYLPENNPLYPDMYVREYLRFVGGMYGISDLKQRVEQMIDRVGLRLEAKKRIGELSKGYRQRVGLAQAMIHDPKVLILDEPTSGLDPNQLVEIRQLIREVGEEKTVMLSTHIMQEVEAICNRVLIINRGNLVADNSVNELRNLSSGARYALIVELDRSIDPKAFGALNGVASVESAGNQRWRIHVDSSEDLRSQVSKVAVAHEAAILGLTREEQSLEDVFKQLTRSVAD